MHLERVRQLLAVLIFFLPGFLFGGEKINILLAGDTATGKTSIVYRWANHHFSDSIFPTISIDMVPNPDENNSGYILDISGYQRFRHLVSCYLPMADGYLLVFDVTDKKSFDDIIWWYQQIKFRGKKNAPIVLLANKIDQPNRQVSVGQVLALSKKLSIPSLEVSALKNINIDKSFQLILDKTQKYHKKSAGNNSSECNRDDV